MTGPQNTNKRGKIFVTNVLLALRVSRVLREAKMLSLCGFPMFTRLKFYGIINIKGMISMMGRKDEQMRIIMINMEEMIPEKHLLRKIDEQVDFDFIYDEAASYYFNKGRPSVDPVCMIKMLLIGYLYGIGSERRLEEEVTLNIAYRWFCGYDLMDKIPDHSTFSQNRRKRFGDDGIFRSIFNQIVRRCLDKGLVTGDQVVSDGTFIPANVSWDSRYEATVVIEQSTVNYLDVLNEEMEKTTGYVEPVLV